MQRLHLCLIHPGHFEKHSKKGKQGTSQNQPEPTKGVTLNESSASVMIRQEARTFPEESHL
jgi:hypothetical protein